MTFPKARLAVSLALFLAWIGYLCFLVYERYNPVLSRAQFAVADAVVIVAVPALPGTGAPAVAVKEILWCASDADRARLKESIVLPELLSCAAGQGYAGPGEYIVLLVSKNSYFQIAPVQQTPGYLRQSASHAQLYLRDGGHSPERVLERLIRYAAEKPDRARGLLEPAAMPIVECIFARALLPHFELPVALSLDLPRYLPIDDARRLEKELLEAGADVVLRPRDLRIYPATPQSRAQAEKILAERVESARK